MFDTQNQPNVDSYLPQRVLSSSSFKSRSDRPAWCEYQRSSTLWALFYSDVLVPLPPLAFLFLALLGVYLWDTRFAADARRFACQMGVLISGYCQRGF